MMDKVWPSATDSLADITRDGMILVWRGLVSVASGLWFTAFIRLRVAEVP
jgi:hypothetical protein